MSGHGEESSRTLDSYLQLTVMILGISLLQGVGSFIRGIF